MNKGKKSIETSSPLYQTYQLPFKNIKLKWTMIQAYEYCSLSLRVQFVTVPIKCSNDLFSNTATRSWGQISETLNRNVREIIVPRSGSYEIARGSSHCMWVFFYFLLFFFYCPLSLIFKLIKYIPLIFWIFSYYKINSVSFLSFDWQRLIYFYM